MNAMYAHSERMWVHGVFTASCRLSLRVCSMRVLVSLGKALLLIFTLTVEISCKSQSVAVVNDEASTSAMKALAVALPGAVPFAEAAKDAACVLAKAVF